MVNFQRKAAVRMLYPVDAWVRFGQLLSADVNILDVSDRKALIDDAFELAKRGKLGYQVAFNVARVFANETQVGPWLSFSRHIAFLNHMLGSSPMYGVFQSFILTLVRSARYRTMVEDKLNWKTLSTLAEISLSLGGGDETQCYSEKMNDNGSLMSQNNLRRAIFTAFIIENEHDGSIQQLHNLSRHSSTQAKRDIVWAIARTHQTWILHRELRDLMRSSQISDALQMAAFATGSTHNRHELWDWLKHEARLRILSRDANFIDFFCRLTSTFHSKDMLEEVPKFEKKI